MVRVFKSVMVAMAGLLLLALAVYALSRTMGASRPELEALAMIEAPVVHEGRDGFAALYTLAHDVPEPEWASLLAEDLRRAAESPPPTGSFAPTWRSALQDWPEPAESRPDDPGWCSLREPGCLQRVRSEVQAYAGLLERNAAQLDRVAALSAWDHFANPFPPRLDMPLPNYQWLTRSTTRDAWRFVNGDTDAALTGACASVVLGRKLMVASDNLIGSMIGTALVHGNASLLGDMLAELPREHALAAQSETAFDLPLPLSEAVCRTMLGEARFVAEGLRAQFMEAAAANSTGGKAMRWTSRLLYDQERTVARLAPRSTWYCGEQARALVEQDRPLLNPSPASSPWSLRCVSNAVGCLLAETSQPAYLDYGLRLQDAGARLRTTAALLWMRGRDDPIDAAALARLPVSMRSSARPLRLDTAAATLGTAVYAETPRLERGVAEDFWALPLPASRLQSKTCSP